MNVTTMKKGIAFGKHNVTWARIQKQFTFRWAKFKRNQKQKKLHFDERNTTKLHKKIMMNKNGTIAELNVSVLRSTEAHCINENDVTVHYSWPFIGCQLKKIHGKDTKHKTRKKINK